MSPAAYWSVLDLRIITMPETVRFPQDILYSDIHHFGRSEKGIRHNAEDHGIPKGVERSELIQPFTNSVGHFPGNAVHLAISAFSELHGLGGIPGGPFL